MAALSGAQPAQPSAGPKRAAWQRALFRFPIPNRRKGVLRHTLLYRVHRSASAVGLFKLRTFAKKNGFMKLFLHFKCVPARPRARAAAAGGYSTL